VAISMRRFLLTKFLSCRATVARRVSSLPVAAKSFRVVSFLGRLLRRATCTRRVTSLTATISLLRVVSANKVLRRATTARQVVPLRAATEFFRRPFFLWARPCSFPRLCIVPTPCICVFRMVLTINIGYFPKQH
jgi:hypothetical protein